MSNSIQIAIAAAIVAVVERARIVSGVSRVTAVDVVEMAINAHPNGIGVDRIAATLTACVDAGFVRRMPRLGAAGYVTGHIRSINRGNRPTWGPAGSHVIVDANGTVRVNRASAAGTTLRDRADRHIADARRARASG